MIQRRLLAVGIPLVLFGGALVVFAQVSAGAWHVEASCDGPNGSVSGTITAESGSHEIEVFVTYHIPADGDWHRVAGAGQILNAEGTGPHRFGPLDVTATPPEANAIRVEIIVTGHSTNEKSDSFGPCGGAPVATSTAHSPTHTSTSQPATATAQPASSLTPPPTNTAISAPTGIPTQATSPTLSPSSTAVSTSTSIAVQSSPTPQPTNTAISTATSVVAQPTSSPTPSPTHTAIVSPTTPGSAQLTATRTSEVSGRVSTATPTATLSPIPGLAPPSSGNGGLIADRTSLTLLGLGLMVIGTGLIAARGFADARNPQ